DWLERIDERGITAQLRKRIPHRGEIDDGRYPGEVLQQHACGLEGDFLFRPVLHAPVRECEDVVALDESAVLVAQQVLEQDFEADGKSVRVSARRRREGVEAEDCV